MRNGMHVASIVVKLVCLLLGLANVQNHHRQPILVKSFFKAGLVTFLVVVFLKFIRRTRGRTHQQPIPIPGSMQRFPPKHTECTPITTILHVVFTYDPDEATVFWYPWCNLLSVPTMSMQAMMPTLTWPLWLWRS